MTSLKELDWYQKGILILLIVMIPVFAVLYAVTTSQVGYAYWNELLMPSEENGATLYSGQIQGQTTVITVSGQSVTLQCGYHRYGPYTVREDPTAIPKDVTFTGPVTGLEIRRGESIYFRGARETTGNGFRLVYEDGKAQDSIRITAGLFTTSTDTYGNTVQSVEPTPNQILDLLDGPKLTHKGSRGGWLLGVLVCLLTAASIFFADELFRLRMVFHVQDVYDIEPSGWELGVRYGTWLLLTIGALVAFIVNLQ